MQTSHETDTRLGLEIEQRGRAVLRRARHKVEEARPLLAGGDLLVLHCATREDYPLNVQQVHCIDPKDLAWAVAAYDHAGALTP